MLCSVYRKLDLLWGWGAVASFLCTDPMRLQLEKLGNFRALCKQDGVLIIVILVGVWPVALAALGITS